MQVGSSRARWNWADRIGLTGERDGRERLIDRMERDPAAERRALVGGLLATPASIAPKYFYDALGCALFGAICELPEYYPTRTEAGIFRRYRREIGAALGTSKQFVDLGAGDCRKAADWLPTLAPWRYVAVDIADVAIGPALARLSAEHPEVEVCGIVTDFTRGLDLVRDLAAGATTFFFPGSSIGNFTPTDATRLLRAVGAHCAGHPGSGLLIGVDTRKDPDRLRAAYADSAGVTAAFNRNVLAHVNRVLGTQFVPEAYDHVALFDEARGRIEMHLQATSEQHVAIEGIVRRFGAGERIHTENSYKYAPPEFIAMLELAGFAEVRCWQDDAGDFAVYYAA